MLSRSLLSLKQLTMSADRCQSLIYQYYLRNLGFLGFFSFGTQTLLKVYGPSARLLGAFAFSAVHLQRQSHDDMGHVLVLNDIQHFIDGKEIVTGNMNVPGWVCKGKLRVGQCESDPGVTQINA